MKIEGAILSLFGRPVNIKNKENLYSELSPMDKALYHLPLKTDFPRAEKKVEDGKGNLERILSSLHPPSSIALSSPRAEVRTGEMAEGRGQRAESRRQKAEKAEQTNGRDEPALHRNDRIQPQRLSITELPRSLSRLSQPSSNALLEVEKESTPQQTVSEKQSPSRSEQADQTSQRNPWPMPLPQSTLTYPLMTEQETRGERPLVGQTSSDPSMAGQGITINHISQYLIDENKNRVKTRLDQIRLLKSWEQSVTKVALMLGLILKEDFGIPMLAAVIQKMKLIPEAMAAVIPDFAKFEEIAGRAGGLITPDVQLQLKQLLGASSSPKVKIGYIAGPRMFEKYGPALVALQRLYGDQTRIVVVVKGSAGEREAQKKMIDALNKGLPSGQTLLYRDDPISAEAMLHHRYQIQILAEDERDVSLLRQILPQDFDLSRSQAQVNHLVSSLPGLSELLAEFSVAFRRALESAA